MKTTLVAQLRRLEELAADLQTNHTAPVGFPNSLHGFVSSMEMTGISDK
jgi:hypothetical protein